MDYQQLRANYDAAFRRLCRADAELRSILSQAAPEEAAVQRARMNFEQAAAGYRAARQRLADFMLRRRREVGRAPHDQVRVLAHRIWEAAGRPQGRADEHWYRAEEMLGGSRS